MNHRYKMEALEYSTVKAMADPVELCSVFHTEHLSGQFQAFELQKAFLDYVTISISRVLPCEVSLKRLQVLLPYESGFNATDNSYSGKGFFKLCEDYGVPHDPIGYQDEKFYWMYQQGVSWPDDYIGPNSMMHWIIEKSQGITDVGFFMISESIRAYTYLILSLQASARLCIIGNMATAFTAQKVFLNNLRML